MKESLDLIAALFSDFVRLLDHRSGSFLTMSPEVLSNVLKWHYVAWQGEHRRLTRQTIRGYGWPQFTIARDLESMISKIEELALTRGQSYLFFHHIGKHAEKYRDQCVGADAHRRYYVSDLLTVFYPVFFETIPDDDASDHIWQREFPKGWKITAELLKTSRFSRVSRRHYRNWARPRITNPNVQFDKRLDKITANLFPKVEPRAWAIILIFAYTSWGRSRVGSVVEQPWNFGSSPGGGQREERMPETFELCRLLFPEVLSKANLEQFIKELEALEYDEQSENDRKRLELLELFQEMVEFLNEADARDRSPSHR